MYRSAGAEDALWLLMARERILVFVRREAAEARCGYGRKLCISYGTFWRRGMLEPIASIGAGVLIPIDNYFALLWDLASIEVSVVTVPEDKHIKKLFPQKFSVRERSLAGAQVLKLSTRC
jgi:hypothetical protein